MREKRWILWISLSGPFLNRSPRGVAREQIEPIPGLPRSPTNLLSFVTGDSQGSAEPPFRAIKASSSLFFPKGMTFVVSRGPRHFGFGRAGPRHRRSLQYRFRGRPDLSSLMRVNELLPRRERVAGVVIVTEISSKVKLFLTYPCNFYFIPFSSPLLFCSI